MKKQRGRKIKTKATRGDLAMPTVELSGWYAEAETYLWMGIYGKCVGTLHGQKLYRFCKTVVAEFERAAKKKGK